MKKPDERMKAPLCVAMDTIETSVYLTQAGTSKNIDGG